MFFKTLPLLGLKTVIPIDDPGLIQMAGNVGVTHDTGGQNISYDRVRNSCTKSLGWEVWNASSPVSANVYGLHEHVYYTGTPASESTVGIQLGNTGIIYYNTSEVPSALITDKYIEYSTLAAGDGEVEVGDTVTGDTTATVATVVTGTTALTGDLYISDITGGTGNFSATESLTFSGGETADCDSVIKNTAFKSSPRETYCAMSYGNVFIFTDLGNNTPKTWEVANAELKNLITATDATLYKFKYLTEWYLHIIGLNSDVSNLEIRWTDALPGTEVSFPAANQIYKSGYDEITGVSKLGSNVILF